MLHVHRSMKERANTRNNVCCTTPQYTPKVQLRRVCNVLDY